MCLVVDILLPHLALRPATMHCLDLCETSSRIMKLQTYTFLRFRRSSNYQFVESEMVSPSAQNNLNLARVNRSYLTYVDPRRRFRYPGLYL
jgi:hypothetical protein